MIRLQTVSPDPFCFIHHEQGSPEPSERLGDLGGWGFGGGGNSGRVGTWKPLSFASFTVAKPHFMDQMFEYFLYDVLDLIKRILVSKE